MRNIKKLIFISLFGIAFGYVEAAVVVYLRALFYSGGFEVPVKIGFPFIVFGQTPILQPITPHILYTEIGREAATIVVLAALAILSGKTLKERFAFFLWAFAVWDIFYYVFLKALLNWPPALSTIDVLFLIPVPWLAPVWLPILASCIMLIVCLVLLSENKN